MRRSLPAPRALSTRIVAPAGAGAVLLGLVLTATAAAGVTSAHLALRETAAAACSGTGSLTDWNSIITEVPGCPQ